MIITIAKHVVYTIINAYLGREHRTRVDSSKHLLRCPDLHCQSSEGSTPQIVQKPCKLVVRCITDKSINFTSYTLLSTCAISKNFNSIQWNVYQFSIFQKNILFPFITFIIKKNKISILKKNDYSHLPPQIKMIPQYIKWIEYKIKDVYWRHQYTDIY